MTTIAIGCAKPRVKQFHYVTSFPADAQYMAWIEEFPDMAIDTMDVSSDGNVITITYHEVWSD